jgi:sensor histidine kinase YesM
MKQLAIWAFHNKWKARTSLVIIHISLMLLAFILNVLVSSDKGSAPAVPFVVPVILLLGIFALGRLYFNWTRRTLYLIKANLSFFIIALFFQFTHAENGTISISTQQVYASKQATTLKQGKSKKTVLKKIAAFFKNPDKTRKTLLTILVILVFLALSMLVAALACSLSCAGNDAGATLLLVGGLSLLTWLMIAVIRRINRGPRPVTEEAMKNKGN